MSTHDRVVITGLGAVTPLGDGIVALASALRRGDHGIRRVPFFDGTPLAGRLGGVVLDAGPRSSRGAVALALALRAIREALASSGPAPAGRTALVVGTTMTPRERPLEALAAQIRDGVGLPGVLVVMVSTACTSSTAALSTAVDLLRAGDVDRVIAGGTDELDVKSFGGFHALGLVCSEPCTPFGPRLGTTLGEGAAFFVLERAVDALARGAAIHGSIEGVATTSDGHHPTSPHPAGDGLARAAHAALADAGLDAASVDWVSAHGTGTRANDAAEQSAVERVLGERTPDVPVTAGKSLVGHTFGAAGAIELAMAVIGLRVGLVPATAGTASRRAGCMLDVVGPAPREQRARRVLKLGAAFGGANAAVVLAAPGAPAAARAGAARRAVRIVDTGGIGGGWTDRDPMGGAAALRGRIGPLDLAALAPGVDPRALDPVAMHLAVAVHRALDQAGGTPWGALAERTGLFVGQRRASPSSHAVFEESVAARGLDRASGAAFTRKVVNAATGAVARAFALRGPTTTISSGTASGLVAVALAAEHLAARGDADRLVVGAAEELAAEDDEVAIGEGAAAVVLEARGAAEGVVLAGWALGGPGEGDAVDERATRLVPDGEPVHEVVVAHGADGASLDGLLALGLAVAAIRRGASRCVRVVERGPLAAAALVVCREGVVDAS